MNTTSNIARAVVVSSLVALAACGTAHSTPVASSAPRTTTPTTVARTRASTPSTPTTPTTVTIPQHGTATDFCSAVNEMGPLVRKEHSLHDIERDLTAWAVDLVRFTPVNMVKPVNGFTKGLFGVVENIGFGVITNTELVNTETRKVFRSADGRAVYAYGQAHCQN
jgi:hypothetical protein